MFEMVFWYFDYLNLNLIGIRFMGVIMWVVIFIVVKKILFRFFFLVVFMGYGVVKLILGVIIFKVFFIGVVYFLVFEVFEFYEYLGNINDFFGKIKLVLVLFVVFLDTCFILWIFFFLLNILEKF